MAWSVFTWICFAVVMAGWGLIVLRQPVGGGMNPLGLTLLIAGTVGTLIYDVMNHKTLYATLDAAYLAWIIWLWWHNGGGGDRTKRRLNRLRRRLAGRQPVPQGA